MTQPAPKRAAPSAPPEQRGEKTGRYTIDEVRRGTVLPPRSAEAELISLEDLGAVMERESAAPGTQPPTTTAVLVSGVFSRKGSAPQAAAGERVEDPELAALSDALEPFYRGDETRAERAVIEIEDFNLRIDNRYIASSLVPPSKRGPNALTKLALVGGALALLGVGGLGALLLRGAAVPARVARPQAHSAAAPRPAPALAPKAEAARPPTAPVAPAVQPAAVATARISQAKPTIPRAATTPAATATRPASSEGSAVAAAPAPAAAAAAPEVSAAAPAPETASLSAALPESPTRADVAAGFQAVQGQLAQCAAGKHGVAKIDATIANSGRISYALIDGQFRGSPEGSCMARAVRAARFPQFSQPNLKVSYPIAF